MTTAIAARSLARIASASGSPGGNASARTPSGGSTSAVANRRTGPGRVIRQSIQAPKPLAPRSAQVGQVLLGPLPGQRDLGFASQLPHAEAHDAALGRADARLKGGGQIVADDAGVAPALLLHGAAQGKLVPGAHEVNRRLGINVAQDAILRYIGERVQVVQRVGRDQAERRTGAVQLLAYCDDLRVERGRPVARGPSPRISTSRKCRR